MHEMGVDGSVSAYSGGLPDVSLVGLSGRPGK